MISGGDALLAINAAHELSAQQKWMANDSNVRAAAIAYANEGNNITAGVGRQRWHARATKFIAKLVASARISGVLRSLAGTL